MVTELPYGPMTMDIYYLLPTDSGTSRHRPARVIANPTGASRVLRVEGNTSADWHRARQRAITDAYRRSVDKQVLVMAGHCDVTYVQRRDMNNAPIFRPAKPEGRWDHSFVLYVQRLLQQYAGAVYVPPLGQCEALSVWEEHRRVLPLVAAFRCTAALDAGDDLGYNLSAKGYRVVTLGDYAYAQHGPTTFNESGNWKKAYEASIEECLGVRSRNQRQR